MDYTRTTGYAKKVNEVRNKSDTLEGCMSRMCLTDDRDELFRMFGFLVIYAHDLYRLNNERICIGEHGTGNPFDCCEV